MVYKGYNIKTMWFRKDMVLKLCDLERVRHVHCVVYKWDDIKTVCFRKGMALKLCGLVRV